MNHALFDDGTNRFPASRARVGEPKGYSQSEYPWSASRARVGEPKTPVCVFQPLPPPGDLLVRNSRFGFGFVFAKSSDLRLWLRVLIPAIPTFFRSYRPFPPIDETANLGGAANRR